MHPTANFEEISGMLTYDEFGDCGVVRYNIIRLGDSAVGVEGSR